MDPGQIFCARISVSTWVFVMCKLLTLFALVYQSDGGIISSPLNVRPLGGPMSLLLTGRDSVAEIRYVYVPFFFSSAGADVHYRHLSDKKADLQHQYNELGREIETARNQFMQLKKSIDQFNVRVFFVR